MVLFIHVGPPLHQTVFDIELTDWMRSLRSNKDRLRRPQTLNRITAYRQEDACDNETYV